MQKAPQSDDDPGTQWPDSLKFLKRLVTILTGTMIVGLVTIIVLFVMRFTQDPQPLALPERIVLPDGQIATAITVGPDWYGVVTADQRILIFDRATARLRQTIDVTAQ